MRHVRWTRAPTIRTLAAPMRRTPHQYQHLRAAAECDAASASPATVARRAAVRRQAAAPLASGAAARLPMLGPRALPAAALLLMTALVATAPAAAHAKTLRAKATDPTGDARTGAVDLTQVTAKYESTGRLRVSISTAAPLDLRAGGQLVVTFAGKSCKADLFGVAADFKDPALPWAYRARGKAASAKPVNGTGTLSGTTYAATFRSAQLAKLKPTYVQAALYPAGTSADALDQTDCIALR